MGEPSNENRRVIPASCTCAGIARGFTNLVIRRLPNGHIELDPHVTGTCVLTLDEDSSRGLHEALGDWLG
ncbi:MAG: hypothetical protein ACRDS0_36460 [Pseudonocardiaceae bacterium]